MSSLHRKWGHKYHCGGLHYR